MLTIFQIFNLYMAIFPDAPVIEIAINDTQITIATSFNEIGQPIDS